VNIVLHNQADGATVATITYGERVLRVCGHQPQLKRWGIEGAPIRERASVVEGAEAWVTWLALLAGGDRPMFRVVADDVIESFSR
jgi:hypothetical protein